MPFKRATYAAVLIGLLVRELPGDRPEAQTALSSPFGQAAQQQPNSRVPPSSEKLVKILGPFLSRDDQDEYTKVVLKNGLTAVVYERKDLPLVAVSTYVKAGYLDEPDVARGISHVLEHMFFKGTPGRGVGRLAKETKGLGGTLNAGTFYEYTHYYTVVPFEHFRQALEIQADALQNPTLDEAELKKEIQVVLQEARRKADSLEAFALEKLYEVAFDASRVRRWRIGDESTLLPLSRKEVVEFYKRGYVPSNIILVICGNVDKRQALDEVVKKYSGMLPGTSERPARIVEPVQRSLRYRQMRGDLGEARLLMGFQTSPAFAPDWHACQVLRAILGEGENSILGRQLREEKSWVSSVAAEPLDLRDQGYLTFRFSLDPARLDAVELAAWVELERFKSGVFSSADIERAKNLLERDLYLNREVLTDFSFRLAHTEALSEYRELRDSVRRIRAVTREQVIQAAQTYLTRSRCTVLEFLPAASRVRTVTAETLTAMLERQLPTALKEAELSGEEVEETEKPKPTKVTPAGPRPAVTTEVSSAWVDSKLTTYNILRGPEVLVKESRALPLVSMAVFFPGGRVFEGQTNNGITELMMRSSTKGAQRLTSQQLLAAFEKNGAGLETHIGPDSFGYVLTGLKRGFEQNFEALLAVIKEPRFDEPQIQKEKALLLADAARLGDNQVLYSRQLFKQALYGGHPYGLPLFGTADSLSRITRDDVIEWHKQFVAKAVPVIVIAGDTEGSELVARLSGYFSTTGAETVDLQMALPVRPPDRPGEKLELRDRRQSATSAGFMTPGVTEPETRVLTVLANLVSGLGGRFFEEIREKQALAYTVTAAYEPAALGGSFAAYVATSPENRLKAVDSLREQFKRLCDDTLTEEELRRARNYSSGMWKMRLQRRSQQVFEFARMKMAGLSVEEIQEYSSQFEFVDAARIRDVARKYFDLNTFTVGGTLARGETSSK